MLRSSNVRGEWKCRYRAVGNARWQYDRLSAALSVTRLLIRRYLEIPNRRNAEPEASDETVVLPCKIRPGPSVAPKRPVRSLIRSFDRWRKAVRLSDTFTSSPSSLAAKRPPRKPGRFRLFF